jgi:hypothetical protein
MPNAIRRTPDAAGRNSVFWLLPAAFVLMVVAGCGTACRCCRPAAESPASAPERVEINGRGYTLTANAWRDFQPVAPPEGQPLIVAVRVSAEEPIPTPADLKIDHVWVLNGKEQWSAKPDSPSSSEGAIRGGPRWGPGIKVDVVARLEQGKKTWLVRAAGVDIKRTD